MDEETRHAIRLSLHQPPGADALQGEDYIALAADVADPDEDTLSLQQPPPATKGDGEATNETERSLQQPALAAEADEETMRAIRLSLHQPGPEADAALQEENEAALAQGLQMSLVADA